MLERVTVALVDVLVVAALGEEVAYVTGREVLVTGVGKARAAATLARRLATGPAPDMVVNVGTAGSLSPDVHGIVEVGFITQHDFPYDGIEALVGAPVDRGYALHPGVPPTAMQQIPVGVPTVATGDLFVADADAARRIAGNGVHLVDMEAYAYATACADAAVPMRCVKVVSDSADADAGDSWLDTIDHCARALADWLAAEL
ncbi:MAG TPA: nucleosidase [Mycobacteriales bacterium]|nr:nucleosidase [Mycobacteriales bacterium]